MSPHLEREMTVDIMEAIPSYSLPTKRMNLTVVCLPIIFKLCSDDNLGAAVSLNV